MRPFDAALLPPFLARERAAIRPLDPARKAEAQDHLDRLTKPVGSLGRLEELAVQLYAVQEKRPLEAKPARMLTFAADHGVVAEGAAASPQAVTSLMLANFLRGGAGINALCAAVGAELRVVDVGVAADAPEDSPMLIKAKIARGSANLARGPAMTLDECLAALETGIRLARAARDEGARVIGTGEMGIGNTTPSSALLCAYLGFSPEEMTGMGAGLPPAGLSHKVDVIRRALALHEAVARGQDSVAILAALGGLEIAALTGLILGGAASRLLVVIDGFIATAAYAAARAIAPTVREYCVCAHVSAESGHAAALARLGEKPLLDLGLRLGEGAGAALGFALLEAAAAIFNTMATFEEAGIVL
jgi:nicotinate-nucleotide--dimethylbenzimidazole phosphoribosyltransferase